MCSNEEAFSDGIPERIDYDHSVLKVVFMFL